MSATNRVPRPRRAEGILPPRAVLGVVLASVGAVVLAALLAHDLQRWTLALVSAIAVAGFVLTREYALAVVAGITGGLGVGLLVVTGFIAVSGLTPFSAPGWLLLSMGAGFVSAWLLGFLAQPAERHPWPIIPGLLIGSIGFAIASGQPGLIDWIQGSVAVLLLAGGIAALLRHRTTPTASGHPSA